MRLADRVSIITGAASGFGAAMARLFTNEGAKVVLVDLDHDAVEKTAQDIVRENAHAMVLPCQADVGNPDAVAASVQLTMQQFGAVDIMVNNAGISHFPKWAAKITDEDFDSVFAVNTKSILYYARHVIPHMRQAQRGGSIITVSSTVALRPRQGMAVYNASKAAAVSLSKTLALELAGDQIRVNTICPGAGETPMLDKFMRGTPAETRDMLRKSIPMNRIGDASEIAAAALYFASDDSKFVTGTVLPVDGGRTI